MSRSFKVHEFWPKPLFENTIDVKSEWIDKSKNLEYERMTSNNGDYTVDKKILDKFPDLKKEILKNVYLFAEKYLKVVDTEFYFTTSWIVKHHPNDWAQAHHHTNSLLSGVYYLETEKNSGDIGFVKSDNEVDIFPLALKPNIVEYNYNTGDEIYFGVEDGLLFIFPSNLKHKVKKNESNKTRYSLAFNLFCKGNFGQKEYELNL